MPRMASRYDATSNSGNGRVMRGASAVASVVLFGAALGMLAPHASAATTREVVLLPGVEARQLDAGIAGWTASFAVTATGCGASPCATLVAGWQAGVGVEGATDGALGVTLRGVANHAGVAVATLRSPVFLVPTAPGAVDVSAAVRSHAVAAVAGGVDSTLTVRLVDVATGVRRTIVDAAPVGPLGGPWTDVHGDHLESGALKPAGAYRLEVDVRFTLLADGAPDTIVQLDRPTLTVEDLVPVAPIGGGASLPTAPPAPTATDVPSVDLGLEAASDVGVDRASLDAPADRRCVEPLTLLGVSGDGSRVTIVGAADAEPGTSVDLRTADGWRLGRALVSSTGTFSGSFRSPAAAGRAQLVIARTSDGEASAPVTVQRRHVVRSVRRTGNTVVVEGTVPRGWGGRDGRARLEIGYGAGDCAASRTVGVGSVRVPANGRYRGVLRRGQLGYQEVRGAHVVSARLTRPNKLGAPSRLDAPLTFVPRSGT